MMLSNSWIMKGAIASVVVGALTYYYFVHRNRKPASLVQALANSNTKSCKDMVEQLLKLGIITEKRVAETMLKVDRVHYVPPHHPTPYKEMAIPIGFNATISAPHMHALGLDILSSKLVNGASVLDIGSGSGYVSACCANMVSPNGRVFGVEHVSELTDQAKVNINTDNPLLFGIISLFVGDGFKGLPTYAPFDAIYVGAASEAIPEALIEQLKPGGRLVIPIGPPDGFHSLVVADKNLDETLTIKNLGTVRFVPLTSYEKQVQEGSTGLTKVVQTDDGENLLMRTQYHPAPDSTPAEIKILKERFTTQL